MPGLGDLFGKGSIFEQLFIWGVLNQVIGALASPYFEQLTQVVNAAHPEAVRPPTELVGLVVRGFIDEAGAVDEAKRSGLDAAKFKQLLEAGKVYLGPADLAQMVVRGFIGETDAVAEAAKSGIDAHRFGLLTKIAADAPGAGDLAVGLRRELIPEDSGSPDRPGFIQGIREGRLGNMWAPLFKGLAIQWPSPTDALQAELEGQVSHEEALALYKKLGGDEQFYTWLFNTRGVAPSPVEGLEMVRRGVIPIEGTGPGALSLHQIFLEGPQRPKWFEPFKALLPYITPPRSVVAMVHAGIISDAKAAEMLTKSGLPPDEIAAYISEGHARASATNRNLTTTTILSLYESRIIAAKDAHDLLTALGYSDENATFEVELADLRRSIAAATAAVNRVHNLYVAHKITQDTARATLVKLRVPADQVAELVQIWDLEESVNVRQLTPAQIVDAWQIGVIDQGEAITELTGLGYTEYDAWLLLSIKVKKAQPGKPSQGPNPLGVVP